MSDLSYNQNASNVENNQLKPTSIEQLRNYAQGTLVELPPFAEGQPFIARMRRPSLLVLIKSGKIPNALVSQASSLFVNGSSAVDSDTDMKDLMDIIEVIAESALIEPSLNDIKSAGMELSDDQLTAIFSYTQSGVRALQQFRTN